MIVAQFFGLVYKSRVLFVLRIEDISNHSTTKELFYQKDCVLLLSGVDVRKHNKDMIFLHKGINQSLVLYVYAACNCATQKESIHYIFIYTIGYFRKNETEYQISLTDAVSSSLL